MMKRLTADIYTKAKALIINISIIQLPALNLFPGIVFVCSKVHCLALNNKQVIKVKLIITFILLVQEDE